MKRIDRVDQHGFPIPLGFDDQPDAPPRPRSSSRKGRWVIVALLAAVIASLVIESPLSTTGRQWVAGWFASRAVEKADRGDLPAPLRNWTGPSGVCQTMPGCTSFAACGGSR